MSGWISDNDRAVYREIADALLPAYGELPAASEAGVADEMLDKVLGWRSDLAPEILRGIATARELSPEEALKQLETDDPPAFDAIRLAALGAYYLNPAVMEALGYPGQENLPVPPEEKPDYLASGVLEPAITRQPSWRSADS